MPLAHGEPIVDTAWLSELLGYAAFAWGGLAAIQFLYAAGITVCLGLLADRTRRQTRRIWPCLVALAAYNWLEWEPFRIVRPQIAGVACFMGLFVYLTQRRWGGEKWIVVASLFAIWANLHGSFIVGLGLLGTFAIGRAADVFRRTRRMGTIWLDRRFRETALLIPLAALAASANPYGIGIFSDVWRFSSNVNLPDVVEWRPLTMAMGQGKAAAVVIVLLGLVYCMTPRRIAFVEPLLLIGFGVVAWWTSRMLVWWSPAAAYYLAIHSAAICTRRRVRRSAVPTKDAGRPVWAFAGVVVALIAVACTPLGLGRLHLKTVDWHRSLSPWTPVDAAAYLVDHPPRGQIFNTLEWGDYLLWAGPPHLRIFVDSHVHVVPIQVWRAYMRVITLSDDWQNDLERFEVTTIVLDREQHAALATALRLNADWQVAYEDAIAVIYVRRTKQQSMG
jgi:hypothetical protein